MTLLVNVSTAEDVNHRKPLCNTSKVRTIYPSVFSTPEVSNELERLHEEFVLVPADKACNNIVFVCKGHFYNCILNELGINSTLGNPTYTPTALSKRLNSLKSLVRFRHIQYTSQWNE
jgi:hypothetical protein